MINIEKIKQDFKDCLNELCYQCGRYKNEHRGACDGCRWHNYEIEVSEDECK